MQHRIRYEKIQYDINREVAKILALSSGKIDKYEYLIGEEILLSNETGLKEYAKFAYSFLGKALEKQTKTIEHQGEKQIKSLEEHGNQPIKSSGETVSLTLLKQKQSFDELINERVDGIHRLSEEFNFNNLISYFYRQKCPPPKKDLSVLTLFYLSNLMVLEHLDREGGKITLPTKNALLVGSGIIPLAHI